MEKEQKMGLRERKKAKTMASIQMHAMRMFREFGYHATTVEQIADAAEISPSTFFRYFTTKEDVVITDNYDPILVAAFEEQPSDLTPIQAVRCAMRSGIEGMSNEELETVRERIQIIMTVPELRASTVNNMIQTMDLIAGAIGKRVGKDPGDVDVRTFVGIVVGVCISAMLYFSEHPNENFAQLLDEGFAKLESGIPL
ncbi:TetR family transcriptional regulator [Paenibacillus terrigena]|uniref:acyl-CoA-like ligand-binding transcription factor n=1 Tax=Paenibacillus terrigena TaxID=369333 RepID=UPI0003711FF4|nr:TetR family transcriptional regulator [Paenibacillus terrigena]